ncbi:LPXTG cell wall anchor domain-containing protein [uncultured Enterococcus sp.]|uniref:LPXTG cell wall anchor domain-containing protein n=1 Tax=uncultured Enterococcus sp. TaxID=167972 RepID=UPI002AA8DCFF|nr:LPXTG cell wall anchor domain-containing protein [uncultured Enterococcus sp.]
MQKNRIVLCLLVALSFLTLSPLATFATSEKESEKSASVQTNGAITFESDATVDSSTSPPTTEPTTTDSSTVDKPTGGGTTKPGGSYPSTGEIVKQGLTIGGVAVIALALLLFFWKRKKEDDSKEGVN